MHVLKNIKIVTADRSKHSNRVNQCVQNCWSINHASPRSVYLEHESAKAYVWCCWVDSVGLYANITHMSHNIIADKHVSETLLILTPWQKCKKNFVISEVYMFVLGTVNMCCLLICLPQISILLYIPHNLSQPLMLMQAHIPKHVPSVLSEF